MLVESQRGHLRVWASGFGETEAVAVAEDEDGGLDVEEGQGESVVCRSPSLLMLIFVSPPNTCWIIFALILIFSWFEGEEIKGRERVCKKLVWWGEIYIEMKQQIWVPFGRIMSFSTGFGIWREMDCSTFFLICPYYCFL